MRKTLWTLNIGNYAPQLVKMTYPLLLAYADKIGADFRIISGRAFPENYPPTYEKLQIFDLGAGNDWNIYIDSDALIFPDLFDVTERIRKDTVAHYGRDHAGNRFRADNYFRRDGRDIGSANWFTVASDWCRDLWRPLDDIFVLDACAAILPTTKERLNGIDSPHLIDDFTLSRNIARFGLKHTTVHDLMERSNDQGMYAWHRHAYALADKQRQIASIFAENELGRLPEVKEHRGMELFDWISTFGTVKPFKPAKHAKAASNGYFVPDISRALQIFGWMSSAELEWLAVQAHKYKRIAEIGCYQGRSTRAMAENTEGIIYAIDTFEGSPEHQGMTETRNLFEKFCSNLEDCKNAMPAIEHSLDYAAESALCKATYNMVFIDAQHEYEAVKADILAWKPLVAPGGLLCGHDFGDAPAANTKPGEAWGVTRAVQEILPDYKRGPGSIWYVEL